MPGIKEIMAAVGGLLKNRGLIVEFVVWLAVLLGLATVLSERGEFESPAAIALIALLLTAGRHLLKRRRKTGGDGTPPGEGA